MKTGGLSILLADDDQDDAYFLQEGLGNVLSHFEVERAYDGAAFMSLVKSGLQPDIVFMDLNMPVKNGLECLRELHNDHLLPDTPVIIYSTSHYLKDITTAKEYGARFYIVKPPSFSKLVELLQYTIHMLGRPRAEQCSNDNFVIDLQKLKVA